MRCWPGWSTKTTFSSGCAAPVFVPAEDPQHADWTAARAQYESRLPAPFTRHWAMDYGKDAEFRPITWLTATFLHGSTGHLLGNMLFLFLFGFSVELALGRTTYLAFYLLGGLGGSALSAWAYGGTGSYGLGASGAVSALMGMYAVLYRLRRVRFFYQLFFYFNYVTAPALLLLPAWIANELLQHWLSGRGVAYMAHLGGLLAGASLMALVMLVRRRPLEVPTAQVAVPDDGFDAHVANAKRLAQAMKFEQALPQWRAAAKLRPQDQQVLSAWFKTASLWPDSEDFHRAARRIFRLRAHDEQTLQFQHASYRTYFDKAKPGARLLPGRHGPPVPALCAGAAVGRCGKAVQRLAQDSACAPGAGGDAGHVGGCAVPCGAAGAGGCVPAAVAAVGAGECGVAGVGWGVGFD